MVDCKADNEYFGSAKDDGYFYSLEDCRITGMSAQ